MKSSQKWGLLTWQESCMTGVSCPAHISVTGLLPHSLSARTETETWFNTAETEPPSLVKPFLKNVLKKVESRIKLVE